jgi:hypothetical protein
MGKKLGITQMKYNRHKSLTRTDPTVLGCTAQAIIVILYTVLGGICTNFLIQQFFTKNISFFWDAVIGFIGGEVIIPVALVTWILKLLGVI